jgi:hypothetical protein
MVHTWGQVIFDQGGAARHSHRSGPRFCIGVGRLLLGVAAVEDPYRCRRPETLRPGPLLGPSKIFKAVGSIEM